MADEPLRTAGPGLVGVSGGGAGVRGYVRRFPKVCLPERDSTAEAGISQPQRQNPGAVPKCSAAI